ncbi:MAG: sporulation transcriptional regulator SpoIIID [Ruminococcus sp.]|nr:sporulation transcriptional regulator SpoIIID [Ruminococcus sp.]
MTQSDEKRPVMIGRYLVKNKVTVRQAAARFGISKSTVHKDVTARLKASDPALFERVREVLDENKAVRHIRGGLATKKKYEEKLKD